MTTTIAKKLVNDPVHGMLEIPPYARAVVATPLFQRLGRVKQLGCLDKVWPSAVHTRLEHSLGTMHLAHTYAHLLGLTQYETKLLGLASLLHDIGHGPFSHTFEHVAARTPAGKLFVNHDAFRCRLVRENTELVSALADAVDVEDIVRVWDDGPHDSTPHVRSYSVLHELLAGDAGVDRMDYILRDSYHTTPQRRLDATCVQSIMHHTAIDWSAQHLLYSDKGARFVGHLLDERAYLYREVYKHKRAVAAESLIAQAFELGLAEQVCPLLDAHKFEQLDDAYVVSQAWVGKPHSVPLLNFLRARLPETVCE